LCEFGAYLALGLLTISCKVLTASPNLSVPSGGWELVCTVIAPQSVEGLLHHQPTPDAVQNAGSRVPDLSLELRDLKVARAALRAGLPPAEHGGTDRGDEEAHISAPPTR
jgi:hypothetical protein